MKGQPALCLAADPATAAAEYYQGLPKPGTLAPYWLHADDIADLTDGYGAAADTRIAEAMADDWKAIARIDGAVPDSWALARELITAGAQGALVPSFQNRGGTAVVLWQWHDAAGSGDGARLALLNPDGVLAAPIITS